jgi:hypothetical protein
VNMVLENNNLKDTNLKKHLSMPPYLWMAYNLKLSKWWPMTYGT